MRLTTRRFGLASLILHHNLYKECARTCSYFDVACLTCTGRMHILPVVDQLGFYSTPDIQFSIKRKVIITAWYLCCALTSWRCDLASTGREMYWKMQINRADIRRFCSYQCKKICAGFVNYTGSVLPCRRRFLELRRHFSRK